MKNIIFLLFCCLWLTAPSLGQKTLSSKAMQEDLRMLKDIAIGVSPKLSTEDFRYIENLVEEKAKLLEGQEMTAFEFADFISQMNMKTQFDEHAYIGIPSDAIQEALQEEVLFPLPVRIIGDFLVVNAEGLDIPFGSVIRTINGERVDTLLKSFVREYNTRTKRSLENQFPYRYFMRRGGFERFDVTYTASLHDDNMEVSKVAGVDVANLGKLYMTKSVFPLNKADFQKLHRSQYYPDLKTMYFQFNSFSWANEEKKGLLSGLRGAEGNFKKVFKALVKDMEKKGAQNLIIDLRHNGGGNILIPALLYSYMAKKPFMEGSTLTIPDFDIPYLNHITHWAKDTIKSEEEAQEKIDFWRSDFEKRDSLYRWEFVERHEVRPEKNAFQGKVYLLVGGRSFSASTVFTALFKSEERGVVVGEQIGGSHHAITAGVQIKYKLPRTGLIVNAPLFICHFTKEIYENVPEDKVIPDVVLDSETKYQHFLKKQDADLQEVLRMIQEGN